MLAGALVATVGVVGVVAARRWLLQDRSRPVPVAEVLERYHLDETTTERASSALSSTLPPPSTDAGPHSRGPLPAPGVYEYTTSGSEHIDVLGGATHDYPPTTTITVTSDPCGVQLRWDALAERWDSWRVCSASSGVTLDLTGVQYHEFFKQPDREAVSCTTAVELAPGVSLTTPCLLDGDPWSPSWTVAAGGSRSVGGEQVDTLRVSMTIAGGAAEQTTTEWVLTTGGLPITATSTKHSVSSSPIGPVTYDEHFELTLTSLTPLH